MSRGSYYTIEYKQPQVIILPILDNRAIVMVRVYRPVIADNTLELPAGGASRNELLVSAAVREFREETGILISDLKRFQMLSPLVNMARSPTLPCIFQVHLVQQEYDLRMDHDHEVSSVECFSYKKVLQKIEQGEIYMGLQIAVIMRYFISNQIIKQAE
ncbi:MAG: NUDIX hydrolase [Candidatus Wolfebacteria bacterium]|nr:NUDIX hydrolase [Candidatus Wolfebacteria bacterium]